MNPANNPQQRLTTLTDPSPLLPLLHHLASLHPQSFFKPLFSLASTSSPASLSTVLHLSSLLGPIDFLLRDAEMMVVALLSDLRGASAGGWERARMGQLAGLVEMVVCVREVREKGVSSFRSFGAGTGLMRVTERGGEGQGGEVCGGV